MSHNAAIVGVSGYGRVHYSLMREHVLSGRLNPVGATIINQDEEKEIVGELRNMGCRIFDDFGDMLSELGDTVDLCFVPTPIHLHATMTCRALEAGWNVLAEKPLAPTIQDIRKIQIAERAADRTVAVGYQEVYRPHVQELKRLLCAGEIGRIVSMKGMGSGPRRFSYYARNNWAGKLKVGDSWVLDSPINNALSHFLHLLLYLAGSSQDCTARPVAVQGELYRAQTIESFDTGCVRIRTDSNIPTLFQATHSTRERADPNIVIEGESGRIEWRVLDEYRIYRGSSDHPYRVTKTAGDRRNAMAEAVVARLTDRQAFICTTESAGFHTLAINGLHESSPIHAVPPELVERIEEGDDRRIVVKGLERIMDDAFSEGKLFSELGVPWAQPGCEVDLLQYRSFPSPSLDKTLLEL
jgi:predicted dehydrogenase